jgi:hypothetical protein
MFQFQRRTSRMIWTAAALATVALGCERKATTTDEGLSSGGAPPTGAATVTITNAQTAAANDPLANVVNRDQLKLDPKATKIDPPKQAVLITGLATVVRESPRGTRIQILENTVPVTEVERAGNYFLVTYTDPNGSNKRMAGWVYRDSLAGEGTSPVGGGTTGTPTGGAPQATAKLACANGEAHLRTTRDFCGKTCSDDRECDAYKKGEVCDGVAFKVDDKTHDHTDARFCIADTSTAPDTNHGTNPNNGSNSNPPAK